MVKERFRELERVVLDSERWRLQRYAATLGIEIISLDLDRHLPNQEKNVDATRIRVDKSKDKIAVRTGGDLLWKSPTTQSKKPQVKSPSPEESRSNLEEQIVTCTIFAPRKVSRGSNILVQVFAHLEKDEAVAKVMAAEFDEEAQRLAIKRLDREVRVRSKLIFFISMPGLQIDEPVQQLIWRGDPEAVQFAVRIPKDFTDNEIVGTIYVTQDTIPFGHLKFLLRIQEADRQVTKDRDPPDIRNTMKRYKYAFISYAS